MRFCVACDVSRMLGAVCVRPEATPVRHYSLLTASRQRKDSNQPACPSTFGSHGAPIFRVHEASITVPSPASWWILMFPHPPPVCHFVVRSGVVPGEPDVHDTWVGGHDQPGLSPPGWSVLQAGRVCSIFCRYACAYAPRCPKVGFSGASSFRSQHSP
jgi:hypothetical protein